MLSLFIFLAAFIPDSYATYGVNLLSSSVKGTGVAGNGISHFYSAADALHKNPATLTESNRNWEFGVISLLPDVKSRNAEVNSSYANSQTTLVNIPTLAFNFKQEKFSWGTGIIPVSGLSSDFKTKTNLFELSPQLSVVNVPLALAKKIDNFSVGISVSAAVGAAAINSSKVAFSESQSSRNPNYQFSWTATAGAQYQVNSDWEVGLVGKLPTKFRFERQTDLESYVGVNGTGLDDLNLSIPAEIGFGVSAKVLGGVSSLETKRVFWNQAGGFKDYGWKDQDVFSLSWMKAFEKFSFSLGYAYATQVFESKTGENGTATRTIEGKELTQQNISYFNVTGYPAILRHHYSVGAGYQITPQFGLEGSVLYCPEENIERSGTGNFGAYSYQTEISLVFANVGVYYNW
jgi:long-chain fatty acid transport protein